MGGAGYHPSAFVFQAAITSPPAVGQDAGAQIKRAIATVATIEAYRKRSGSGVSWASLRSSSIR
jgi:hypothetical protein